MSIRLSCILGGLGGVFLLAVPGVGLAQQPEVVDPEISTEYQNLTLSRVAGGLQHPWAVALLPDDRILVTERPGALKLIQGGTASQVRGLPGDLVARNQGGLLDVVAHPQYASNGWIYLTYSKGDTTATVTALIRARLEGDQLVDVEELFAANRPSEPGRHYGSRILFLNDGTLLMTVGDRGSEPDRAQDPRDHAGTVLRLNDDGTVPPNNPFVGDPQYAPEIYSYGHRNIQGIVQHPVTGDVWATEHGPRGSDELNLIVPGRNYGWPEVSLGRDYRTQEQIGRRQWAADMQPPVFEFLPTLAPSGLAVVHGAGYDDRWQGNLLAGGLSAQRILRLVVENQEVVHAEELLLGKVGRIRDVRKGSDGALYVLSDEQNGALYRVEPTY
jgi:aldose sugar dehydrogenase